jgi:hypothetical protein
VTWQPSRSEAAEREAFIKIYGEDLWNQIQELTAPKPLADREVMKPRRPAPAQPAQNEDADDLEEWER